MDEKDREFIRLLGIARNVSRRTNYVYKNVLQGYINFMAGYFMNSVKRLRESRKRNIKT